MASFLLGEENTLSALAESEWLCEICLTSLLTDTDTDTDTDTELCYSNG